MPALYLWMGAQGLSFCTGESSYGLAYFSNNNDQETIITDISVDRKGSLSEFPDGLLDEWGVIMTELFSVGWYYGIIF